tara:strand:- start:63573 stop:64304 length:732 start_codon:yes stop_codon:yes gene_type:complete
MEEDIAFLIRDKYNGDASVDLTADLARLKSGEPLAYVIGWVPFLNLKMYLSSHPLIPRPETEWWTQACIQENKTTASLRALDLCAGSGAIGLALLDGLPESHVSFAELSPEHSQQIADNLTANGLDASRADIRTSDVFEAFGDERWNLIVCNPPYIPSGRKLEASVTDFEPSEALFSGPDGMELIRRIVSELPKHLLPGGQVWLECDISNIAETSALLTAAGCSVEIRNDQYGRPRVVVGYFS